MFCERIKSTIVFTPNGQNKVVDYPFYVRENVIVIQIKICHCILYNCIVENF